MAGLIERATKRVLREEEESENLTHEKIDWVLARDLEIFNESLEIPVYFATRMEW